MGRKYHSATVIWFSHSTVYLVDIQKYLLIDFVIHVALIIIIYSYIYSVDLSAPNVYLVLARW